ncbi:uncharacterized protein LOC113466709 [Diaphorina citri]|uniref:Uncharacterized protein LOC113466709 n=1 Tax=Diaphorina citri TaxID=121845 RepID=A0A3Q0IPG1_DIACI|nr:uncharacterized protein LOC113466709 [Diaphorina citri]
MKNRIQYEYVNRHRLDTHVHMYIQIQRTVKICFKQALNIQFFVDYLWQIKSSSHPSYGFLEMQDLRICLYWTVDTERPLDLGCYSSRYQIFKKKNLQNPQTDSFKKF